MIPDIEKITSDYLRAHPDVEDLVGRRVVAYPPDEKRRSTPWVRITLLDAPSPPRSSTDHLIRFLVQFDCYAGEDRPGETHGQPEANLLARTVRAALLGMPAASHDGAVVTDVRFAGMIRLPDTNFEPARERVALTTEIYAHSA